MAQVRCTQCGGALEREGADRRVPTICGGIMGDEYLESYHLCRRCGVYTVEVVHDRFLGEEDVAVRGPLSPSEAAAHLDLIRRCPEPWNKKCRCAAHVAYFGGRLD